MEWIKINNIILSDSWQLLSPSVAQGDLFRITESWDIYPQGTKALIAQSLTSSSPFQFFGTRRFYPSDNLKIINLAIPADFIAAGINSRYLLMKFYSRRHFTFNWNVTVESFINI
ncbi:MAG: hypothetical protein V7K90_18760 [Nostoc sp.]|uniref:hypothetical protein n=1 Tax=Nostoc sp. TaxID=1180 RepID=UPI002FF8E35C